MRPLALIIEDDEASAEALSFIVNDWGAEVLASADGAMAEAAIAGRLDQLRWIITDFHLGDGPDGVYLRCPTAAEIGEPDPDPDPELSADGKPNR